MKRNITILSVFALVISLLSLGSLAYFTSSQATENEITTGTIAINLHDLTVIDQERLELSEYEGVMPGDVLAKEVSVSNAGGNAAWVRVRIDPVQEAAMPDLVPSDPAPYTLNINFAKWTRVGDWYYYGDVLEPGESSDHLFTTMSFPITLHDEYQGQAYHLDLEAEAVQVANNWTDVLDAAGWPSP